MSKYNVRDMRLRITFSKAGAAKYSGHLDLHKTWERILRRAGLPLAYSRGFHPQPKIHLAAALPLGFTSECEIVDVWLTEAVGVESAMAELHRATSPGIEIKSVRDVAESLPALQTLVRSADYVATVPGDVSGLDQRVAELLSAATLPRERRGKVYDLRPLIESLSLEGNVVRMRLAARDAATGRPEEVLAALGLEDRQVAVHRTALHFIDNAG
jgi:radical SAM-linked protein